MAAKSDALVASLSKNVHTAEMLIEMVRNYPVLYDKRHPKHKDSLLKDDLWRKIGSELELTGKYEFCCLRCFASDISSTSLSIAM
ncbi:hypothetical protein HPB50_021417 [Hyalomma asiaticum]|uniref:Uncharacterized protein n=1 Tax=Hyalomma asiaticum TaxID=266040 RepID=A0ACB7RJJ2_HYAAI|nr:hypothetical protein HPB50_021417 [Hyalomma asiaticum]